MSFTYLVSAQTMNDVGVQIGTASFDVAWERPPRDRAEGNQWLQEITDREWASGALPPHHRYRIAGWSEYAR